MHTFSLSSCKRLLDLYKIYFSETHHIDGSKGQKASESHVHSTSFLQTGKRKIGQSIRRGKYVSTYTMAIALTAKVSNKRNSNTISYLTKLHLHSMDYNVSKE